jgi:hypothetical protein
MPCSLLYVCSVLEERIASTFRVGYHYNPEGNRYLVILQDVIIAAGILPRYVLKPVGLQTDIS